ncbi:MAG: TadE/TadG family type IV pilus assembly protein [Terriglobales bacterium]
MTQTNRSGVGRKSAWRRNLLRDTAGAEIAEAAVILPLLFMLLFGIMWFGRAFNIYATVNRAARQGALVAAAPNCATCGNTFRNSAYIQSNVVNPILLAAHLDPGQVQNFSVLWNQPLNPGSPLVEQGTIVSLDYPYSFRLNGISCCPPALSPITTGVTIKARAQARQED